MSDERCIQVVVPAAEAKFQKALQNATTTDANVKECPSLYANWHSIIRHRLWYRSVTNGPTFGDGVYLAKEPQTSMGHYDASGRACWRKGKLGPTSCVALAEVVNLPKHWCLLIKSLEAPAVDSMKGKKKSVISLVKFDPAQTITLQVCHLYCQAHTLFAL
ncbi:hypothetical protein DFH08DRAFT_949893 [Mycena albidolilacea]|uniref:PARP catalytic domain-containing protein n=1 Tax=Mycena albidolilacea TaxID=1033008 RepID=A0AAD7AQ05_9AGAR|nr:hypothetical protein DFH08DRAFT_949893 [Mycena albidolilacea]